MSNNQYHQQNRVYEMGDLALCVPSSLPGGSYNYIEETEVEVLDKWVWEVNGKRYMVRIRKLTPRECWRLMGFTDEDFDKASKVNSNTSLYKQAGNSIVPQVLEEIFKNLIKGD